MFILSSSIKNIIRNKNRYIVFGLFLLCTFSILACALYFPPAMNRYMENSKNTYLSRVNYRFKYDNISDEIYNIPIHVKRHFFDRIAQSSYVQNFVLSYSEYVYGVFKNDESDGIVYYRNLMYGGTFESLKFIFEYKNFQLERFIITQGQEHGSGECLIYEKTAKELGYSIGDYITYNDEDGNPIGQLRISGFFSLNEYNFSQRHWNKPNIYDQRNEVSLIDINKTNPFFKYQSAALQYMIITDFDTVYNIYGDSDREINKYTAWYVLDDYRNLNKFIAECEKNGYYSDVMGFFPDTKCYKLSIDIPNQIIGVAGVFELITSIVSALILIVMILYMFSERKLEIGIRYALGAAKKDIILMYMCETIILALSVSIVSVGFGLWLANMFAKSQRTLSELNMQYYPSVIFCLKLFGISIIVSAIASIACALKISKSSPSGLIAERNI